MLKMFRIMALLGLAWINFILVLQHSRDVKEIQHAQRLCAEAQDEAKQAQQMTISAIEGEKDLADKLKTAIDIINIQREALRQIAAEKTTAL